jgi:hypothetical protein
MHHNTLLDLFIIIAVSIYFAYVLRVSLRKIYPEYKKPPWQSTAAMLGLAAFFILFLRGLNTPPLCGVIRLTNESSYQKKPQCFNLTLPYCLPSEISQGCF